MTRRIVDEPPLEISPTKKPVSPELSAYVPCYLEELVQQARGLKPLRTAVVHPVDGASLSGAIEAARAKLIIPVLIGPEARIRAAAQAAHIDLSDYELVGTEHSHAAAAAAVALARERRVAALMKGSLHTDEFMEAIVCEPRLRTARRMSHVFIIEAPAYPRPLFVTDAALNIYPTLEDKVDIVQNAIDLARTLGLNNPKVAILSAVETVPSVVQRSLRELLRSAQRPLLLASFPAARAPSRETKLAIFSSCCSDASRPVRGDCTFSSCVDEKVRIRARR